MSRLMITNEGELAGARKAMEDVMAAHPAFTISHLRSNKRSKPIVKLRMILMDRLITEGMSTTKIGWLLGKDHSTVVKGAKRYRLQLTR